MYLINANGKITGNRISEAKESGIRCEDGEKAIFSDNIVYNCGQATSPTYPYGIWVRGGANPILTNNVCYDDQTSQTMTKGIVLEGDVTDYILMGNVCTGLTTPFELAVGSPISIAGNNPSILKFKDLTTDASGQIAIDFGYPSQGPWTALQFDSKPSISVVFEGNYLWYVTSWHQDANSRYDSCTIQVTDVSGTAVGSGVVAHVDISP